MKSTRGGRRRARLAFMGAPALVVASSASSGCSAKHDAAPGAIMVAVGTNLKVSGDLDEIGISVTSADGSKISEDQTWQVAPVGPAKFPATLAVVRGTSQPVKIRVVGFQGGNPITLREAVTTIPADYTALLRMDIDWLDEGTAGAPATAAATGSQVSSLTSLVCPAGQTSIAGACSSFQLDSATLGQFETSSDTVASDGPECFDVAGCFAGTKNAGDVVTTLPVPSASDCSITVPAVAAGQTLNLALNVKSGHGGWCGADGCVVPLENDRTEGWSITKAGRLQLPAGACTNGAVESIAVLVGGCDSYTPAHPACEAYGGDGGTALTDATVPPPGMDATIDAPVDGGPGAAPDAEPADGAPEASIPDGPFTYVASGQLADFAVTESHVFVVVQDPNTGVFGLQVFPRSQPAAGSPVVPIAGYVEQRAGLRTAANGSTLAVFSGNALGISELLAVSNDGAQTDAGTLTPTGTFQSLGLAGLAGGGLRAFVGGASDPASGVAHFCWADNGGPTSCTVNDDGSLMLAEYNPADGKYGLTRLTNYQGLQVDEIFYSAFDPTKVSGGAFAGATEIAIPLAGNPVKLAFVDGTDIAWVDVNNNVFTIPTAGGTAVGVTDASVASRNGFAAAQGYIAWINDTNSVIDTTQLDAGTLSALHSVQDAGATKIAMDGPDLFWTDNTNVYSVPLSAVPLAPVIRSR